MKKEFSADLIARQRLLIEREQAQDIEKNILTTNQQTGLARGNPFTQAGKARMEANKAGKQYNQMAPEQQQAFRQQMQSQNIAMNPQGTSQLSAGSGRGTKHGFAGSLANSMMNVHNTQQREGMQNQFAGMGGNPTTPPANNAGAQNPPSTGNTGSNNVTTQTGTNNSPTTQNNVTTPPTSQNNQQPNNQQLPNQTPPRIQPQQNQQQGGGGGNQPQQNQQQQGQNQPQQNQQQQGQNQPQQGGNGGNNQMQQMAQNYGAAQDMSTLQGGRQGKESWLRNADGSMKGMGQLGASVAGGVLTGGLSNLAGAGMRAIKNRGVNAQNQQFDGAANRMNQRAMGGNPMMQYKASQESADRIYSSIEHIGIRKSISGKEPKNIFDLTEDDVSEEEMHNRKVIEAIYGLPYEQALDVMREEEIEDLSQDEDYALREARANEDKESMDNARILSEMRGKLSEEKGE